MYPTSDSSNGTCAHGDTRIVELSGQDSVVPFTLGGPAGNAVTISHTPKVRKGWRAVAVNAVPVHPGKIKSAVDKAHHVGKQGVRRQGLLLLQSSSVSFFLSGCLPCLFLLLSYCTLELTLPT